MYKKLLLVLTTPFFLLPLVSANTFYGFGRDFASIVESFIGVQPNFMIRLALFAILFGTIWVTLKRVPVFKSSDSYGSDSNSGAVMTVSFALSLLVVWVTPDEYINILREILGLSFVYGFTIIIFTFLLYLGYKDTDPNNPATQFFRTGVFTFGLILFLHLSTANLGFIDLSQHDFGFWLFLFAIVMLIMLIVSLIHFVSLLMGQSPDIPERPKKSSGGFFSNLFSSSPKKDIEDVDYDPKLEDSDSGGNDDSVIRTISMLKRRLAYLLRAFNNKQNEVKESVDKIKKMVKELK